MAGKFLAMLVALALAFAGLVFQPTWAATAPVVTSVGTGEGPLAPHRVTMRGSGLRGAVAVRFGDRLGSRIRVISSTSLSVTTPRMPIGTARVRVKTRTGAWQARAQRTGSSRDR
jgi:hypothetical protein